MSDTHYSVAGSGSTVVMTVRARVRAGVDPLAFRRVPKPIIDRWEADT